MATAYHRDQVGAPGLVYGNNLGFAAFKTILKACLVSGYGAQPAAGWHLIAEGTNHLVLSNGTGTGYISFTFVANAVIRVYVGATFTGVVADVMQGDGVKTGVATGNSVPQVFSSAFLSFNTNSCTWSVVADDRTFMVCIVANGLATPGNLAAASEVGGLMLYGGEDSAGNFISIGGNASAQTLNLVDTYLANFSTAAGVTLLKNPATGLLVGSSAISVVSPGLAFAGTSTTSLFLPQNTAAYPELVVAPIEWGGGGAYAGRLRGVVLAANLPFMFRGGVAAALGRASAFTSRNCSVPFDLGDGANWIIACGNDRAQPTMLLTDNEAHW
jgi:hypothetical protein